MCASRSVDHLGFLVLDGLVGRRVQVPERGRSLELLGRGDLFRPWQDDSASFSRQSWTVLEPASIAVLDQPLAARAEQAPQLLGPDRSRSTTITPARRQRRNRQHRGVEERLLLSLWQLAELWGRKAPGGAVLPCPALAPDACGPGRCPAPHGHSRVAKPRQARAARARRVGRVDLAATRLGSSVAACVRRGGTPPATDASIRPRTGGRTAPRVGSAGRWPRRARAAAVRRSRRR